MKIDVTLKLVYLTRNIYLYNNNMCLYRNTWTRDKRNMEYKKWVPGIISLLDGIMKTSFIDLVMPARSCISLKRHVWNINTFFTKTLSNVNVKAAITCRRNACVIKTDGHPLKIAQQRNRWVYYTYAFPMGYRKGVRFVSHSERFLTHDEQ